jgi:hypothetical protein
MVAAQTSVLVKLGSMRARGLGAPSTTGSWAGVPESVALN